ncbi:hypothetical protein LJC49_08790 [Ruminococcaceae bacterium OttesenSCG-928-I18]|nr:hypothetical protein [Ruminococcaceae bacterium OttesenSCG-928-I18]
MKFILQFVKDISIFLTEFLYDWRRNAVSERNRCSAPALGAEMTRCGFFP